MKNIITIFTVMLLAYNGYAQQLMQKISDAYKLEQNKVQFVNKPLKNLLKEIKPEIKTAVGFNEYPDFFNFRFTTLEQQRLRQGTPADRVSLYVTVKEEIKWKWNERPKGKEVIWTKEDAEKYGNLTVIKIEVVTKI